MADGREQLNIEAADEEEIKQTPVKFNCLRIIPFILYYLFLQSLCLVAYIPLLFGIVIKHGWVCDIMCRPLCVKFATTPKSKPLHDDTKSPVCYLFNHRSFADFWMDMAMAGGPSVVARWLVFFGVPITCLWGWTSGFLWFFKRDAKRPGGTTKFLIDFYQRSHTYWPGKGLIVYPEGTRSTKLWGNDLKPGGLAVAHTIGWPVQCIVTTNKENVFLESKVHVGFGVKCTSSVSATILPADYATTDEFIEAVRKVWKETWKDAYTAEGIPRDSVLLPGGVQQTGASPCPGTIVLNVVRVIVFGSALLWYFL